MGTTSATEAASTSASNQNTSTVESLTQNSTSQSRTYSESNVQSNSNTNSVSESGSTSTSGSLSNGSNSSSTSSSSSSSESGSTSSSTSSSTSDSTSTSSSSSTSGSTTSGSTSTSASDNSESGSTSDSTSLNESETGSLAQQTLNLANLTAGTNASALNKMLSSSFVQVNEEDTDAGTKVSTAEEFQDAINDKNVTEINLTGDLDLSGISYGSLTISHSLTINANGHKIYLNGTKTSTGYTSNTTNNIYLQGDGTNSLDVTVKNADIYSSSNYGAFREGSSNSNVNLTSEDTNITGGTAVRSETVGNGQNTVTIKGNVNINASTSYTAANGSTVTTKFWNNPNDSKGTSQLYVANGVTVSDGASLNMNANGLTAYNVDSRDNMHAHFFNVGNNANVTLEGATTGNVIMNQPIAGANGASNSVDIGDNSNVTMKAGHFNLYMDDGNTDNGLYTYVAMGNSVVRFSIGDAAGNIPWDHRTKSTDGNIIMVGSSGYYTVDNAYTLKDLAYGTSEIYFIVVLTSLAQPLALPLM